MLLAAALLLASCLAGSGDAPPATSVIPSSQAESPAPATPAGEQAPAPLADSVLMLRRARDGVLLGAALAMTDDGFLLTTAAIGREAVEVVLPDGTALRPVPVAHDADSGLTLLKIAASSLAPVRLRQDTPPPGEPVVAVGFDRARGVFAQVGGHLTPPPTPEAAGATPDRLRTDIPLIEGFTGGALANRGGAVLGILTAGQETDGRRAAWALPAASLTAWFDRWRSAREEAAAASAGWPQLDAAGGLFLRYPAGWSVAQAEGTARDYRAEIVPKDPDAPLRLSLTITGKAAPADPLGFARREFGDRGDATIWGTVSYGGLPGVRVVLDQEGARIDVVYLFHDNRQITISLTSGYGPDADAQAERAAALFEAVLRSITLPHRPVG
ncbi:MAG: serine protease [Sphaerobacter sp.]|nr:serine protease [Sphaerobacter sp.]